MNKETAHLLLENLIERIEVDGVSGKYRLGTISSREKLALEMALRTLVAEPAATPMPVTTAQPATAPEAQRRAPEEGVLANAIAAERVGDEPTVSKAVSSQVTLDLRSLAVDKPHDPMVKLCLDFGTAMSKAFAMTDAGVPFEIALGKRAGGSGYPVASSMFIADSGLLYFGPQAVAKGEDATEMGRVRFDSLKSRLNVGAPGGVDRPVDRAINPTDVTMTEADMITLYLGYLTDLATSELEANGVSRYVVRRFARPCWDDTRNEWAEKLLRRMLARAQIIADTFHGRWQNGLRIEEVKQALDKITELAAAPDYLLDHGIPEPVAAAASLMVRDEAQRELFLVVDVGAGTTDFGLFMLQHNPDRELCRVHVIPGTIQYLPQAGDLVDGMLKKFILDAAGIDGTDHQYGRHLDIDLQSRIRFYKEALFRDGTVEVPLANQTRVTVNLEEFTSSRMVGIFEKQLDQKMSEVLNSVFSLSDASQKLILDVMVDRGLNVVLTGGGADLPMVTRLASGVVEMKGRRVLRKQTAKVPVWVDEDYPKFKAQYAQLAVAIGGASPDLPDMGLGFSG